MNTGEFYIQYNRIDPITLLTSPTIICYLSYRNASQFNNGISVNGPVTINGNNFTVNISDTGECTINCKNINFNSNGGSINFNANGGSINLNAGGLAQDGTINIGNGTVNVGTNPFDILNLNSSYFKFNGSNYVNQWN